MVKWVLAENIQHREWDNELLKFSNFDFYQCYDWGEYKKNFGWSSYRFLAINSENKVFAMAQLLLKKLPLSMGILWCPGGPVGDENLINKDFIMDDIDKILSNLHYDNVSELVSNIINIPKDVIKFKLSEWGVKKQDIPTLVNQSFTKGRMENNIITLSNEDVKKILLEIY